jgi:hypothetical protein
MRETVNKIASPSDTYPLTPFALSPNTHAHPTPSHRILEDEDALASIRAYDATKASGDEAIPFEQAVKEIEKLS